VVPAGMIERTSVGKAKRVIDHRKKAEAAATSAVPA
jgi:phenylacetate-CoA ligase